MRIRKFRKEDAVKASNVIKKGFQVLIGKGYTKESIEVQIKENSPKNLIIKSKTVKYYVAVEKDRILGIGGYDAIKVHAVFVPPEHHRKGIGKKIMERILKDAKKDNIKSLKVWSTFYAENFYKSFGFKKIKKLNLKCSNDSPITFIEMLKKL